MKKINPLVLSILLLTLNSGPVSSGSVEIPKTDDKFPFGDCRGSDYLRSDYPSKEFSGCGWIIVDEKTYYINPSADLGNANLSDANLGDANLADANLKGASLFGANLKGANLQGATLYRANLFSSFLFGVNLKGANLNGADLTLVDLSGANLRGAILTGANQSLVKANSKTVCPNGKNWGTPGNDCDF
jgi:hypothetical protein